jgi:hypothetical protein
MRKHDRLYLHEELLLLALHDEKGTIHFGATFDRAAGGAILAELLLAGRLGVEGEKGKARIVVKDSAPLGEPLLDECLEKIAGDEKRRKPAEWVRKFALIKKLKKRIAARLVADGVLREAEDRVLLVFNRTVFPELDSRPEQEIARRIRSVVIGSRTQVEPRTVVLIALAKHTGLLHHAVEKSTLKEHKATINQLIKGDVASQATKEAVEAMQAALMVVIGVPVVVGGGS